MTGLLRLRGALSRPWRSPPRPGVSRNRSGGHQALFAAVLILAAGLLAGPLAARQRDVPGEFDFYVLSLSWSPAYCEAEGGRADDEPQCSRVRPYAFVVHGLWPQYERGFPQSCARPAPYVPNPLVNSMLDVMPSRQLVIHEWKKHGTCSGLSSEDYFALVRKASAKVTIPPQFVRLNAARTVSPDEVEQAFEAANPGLEGDMISVGCDRRRLREVRICLSRDLGFRTCPEVNRLTCRRDSIVMPPVRGGN